MDADRIGDYALLGDTQTAALVGRTGNVDWLCLPRFDSAACFAALLGDEENGRWELRPVDEGATTTRRYRRDTLILETEWETTDGAVRVIDFMPPRGRAPDIVRIVEGIHGSVDMTSRLRLRFGYGNVVPWVRHSTKGLTAIAGPDFLGLRTPIRHHGKDMSSVATFTVSEGDRVPFVLTWHPSHEPIPDPVDAEQALQDTEEFWVEWVRPCEYDGPWRDAVVRSLITLKALTYSPTGGIVAAPTTSLPEWLGGSRNWDYRYCWLRDSTFTLQTLLTNGYHDEAKEWRQWLLRAIAGKPEDIQVLYGVGGERWLPEWEADWLAGHHGSRPVRIGNDAMNQLQLDIFGEVIDSLALARSFGLTADEHALHIQRVMLDHLAEHWTEPDEGIWEVRGQPRHFVHSKVMAWVAFDRAVRAVENGEFTGPVDRWVETRDTIRADILEHGYDDESGTFVQYYDADQVDAALLLLGHVGFIEADDPRFVRTVERIGKDLEHAGLIRRYPADESVDGLEGDEGAFVMCTFWYVEALALIGREDEARDLFERLLDIRNDLGLLAEEYDPDTGDQLGNFPQAFSHVALVNAAHHLTPAPKTGHARLRIGLGGN